MRLVTDTFAYCRTELPAWNTISISGYHMREAGATAIQEVAFTIANAIAYADAALAAGMAFDDFAPRLSFFFAAHGDLLEEVAKFRAARRTWATVARDRFGANDPKSLAMRFHVQTGGSTLTAQQPDVNVVRTTVQALAAVLGGTQSLHTNALDEALGLPTPATARLGAPNTTSVVSRGRRRGDRRPAGGVVLRRDADRDDPHRRDGRARAHRLPWRDPGRARGRLPAGRDRRRRLRGAARRRGRGADHRRRQRVLRRGRRAASRAAGDRSRARARARSSAPAPSAHAATSRPPTLRSPRSPPLRRGRRTSCRASAPRSRPTSRSERSRTRLRGVWGEHRP